MDAREPNRMGWQCKGGEPCTAARSSCGQCALHVAWHVHVACCIRYGVQLAVDLCQRVLSNAEGNVDWIAGLVRHEYHHSAVLISIRCAAPM